MRIAVLTKVVPDTWGRRTLDLTTGLAERPEPSLVVDEIGERAAEAALRFSDANDGIEVVAVSMGPASIGEALRKVLVLGADSALHILDDALVGADLTLTAEVLAAALRRGRFDLVLTGDMSTDGVGGVLPGMLAEHLGVPFLAGLTELSITEQAVRGTRVTERDTTVLSADLPAVVSITEALPDPRFPNFKSILRAKRKPVEVQSAADLGVDVADESVARSIVVAVTERPARAAGEKLEDAGDGGERIAEFLFANRLI